jgi:hypothetical protein
VQVDEALQQILAYGCVVVYIVGAIIFLARARMKHVDYLRQFPPVEGIRLDTFTGGNPFGPVARAISEVLRESQPDLELERQRLAVRWAFGALATWIFGFPVLAISVAALLILVGLVHPH